MKITRKRELRLTRERKIIINSDQRRKSRFCQTCQTESFFLTVDEAALIANLDRQTIFQLIANCKIHLDETSDRLLRVCLQSLISLNHKTTGEK